MRSYRNKDLKFNLIRQKCDDYKKEQPEAINKLIQTKSGEKVTVADFEVFCRDYPYGIPIVMYDVDSPHVLEPEMPFIALEGELWGVKGFIHVHKNLINIHCVYCGETKDLPLLFPDDALKPV